MKLMILLVLVLVGCAHRVPPITPERLFAQPCSDQVVVCDQPLLLKQILMEEL